MPGQGMETGEKCFYGNRRELLEGVELIILKTPPPHSDICCLQLQWLQIVVPES